MGIKLLDPQIVMTRAERMMKWHVQLFEKHFGAWERDGTAYIFTYNRNTRLRLYLESHAKLLTKVFTTTVEITVDTLILDEDWQAKVCFDGFLRTEHVSLKPLDIQSQREMLRLNQQKSFQYELNMLFGRLDVQDVHLQYQKEQQRLRAVIRLYPGALVWVKLPPAYYDIRLKEEEVARIYQIADFFSDFARWFFSEKITSSDDRVKVG